MSTRLFVAFAVICLAAPSFADDAKPKKKAAVAVMPADLKWEKPKDAPEGVQFAVADGDPSKGSYCAFVKFAPGLMNPLHTHSNDVVAVVMSGTWMYGEDAASAREYGPGSYFYVFGNRAHVSGCKAGAECMIFQTGLKKFDMKPAGEMKADKKEMKAEMKAEKKAEKK